MSKERRLGRGLEALLGAPIATSPVTPAPLAVAGSTHEATAGPLRVSVYDIEANPYQPRREFDEAEIDQLSNSLQEHGLLQPILVRRVQERYQLVAGERRLRAAIKAGWPDVPVHVIEADDRKTAEISIVENLQRKDLNALEKAASFQRYLETYECTQDELAGRLQLDRSTIANLIRLLELPEPVQQSLRSGEITAGHARALLPLGDEPEQVAFCRRIVADGLSVRTVESLVQEAIRVADAEPLDPATSDTQVDKSTTRRRSNNTALEQELRAALGTKVDVRQGAKGRGRIVIHFANADEFERLRNWLRRDGREAHSQAG
ncbi:MAG TPA: ParB/RepB/Spo0J family partition protein [Pirellulales bacterium]|jgi:ParB family chromosome partitioning protein|nr:ParB/RepB/Spo0J family partition protein [Pirellulales bacterium]